MGTYAAFQSFYEKDLVPDLNLLEEERKKVLKQLVITLAIGLVGGICGASIYSLHAAAVLYIIPAAAIIYALICYAKYNKLKEAYSLNFKKRIVQRIVDFIQPGLTYDYDKHVSQELFTNSDIFRTQVDSYVGDDCVTGTIDKTDFTFSELHAQHREVYYNNGRREERWVNIFKGIFFVADFNKHFNGRTFVLPDKAENFLGGVFKFVQKLTVGRGQLVKLENVPFEKEFVVYSDDQIEARYILSPALMERILRFKQEANANILLSFVNSCMYLAIPLSMDLFEAKIFSSGTKLEYLASYHQYMNLAINIIEDLNLNTRIWSKQ